jgi:hypothetical protein
LARSASGACTRDSEGVLEARRRGSGNAVGADEWLCFL